MQKYDAAKMIGQDIDVTAGVGEKETPFQLDKKNGDVIGISVAENYARVDLAKCLLTIDITKGDKVLISVPVTQLLPDGERQMWPCEIPSGANIVAKLVSRSANTVVATPITLIFHYRNPRTC